VNRTLHASESLRLSNVTVSRSNNGPAALNYTDDQNHDGKHQQNVDIAVEGVGRDQSQRPQYEQNHRNGPKHF
jgi:hypothetical protein